MNEYIINVGCRNDKRSIGLATRKGNYIENARKEERAPDAMRSAYEMFKKQHSSIEARSLSASYNCMGMVFASRRTNIDVERAIKLILKDDEYVQVVEIKNVQKGDIVVYYKDERPTHVGVVVNIEKIVGNASWDITILSQWGNDGEYFHNVSDVPVLYGTKIEYWTDRKNEYQ